MPSATSRRGRPKGSGLDDRAALRQIGEMLEADPGLKPTTAIKAIGVSDPSTIRRLRDKLKGSGPELSSSVPALPCAGVPLSAAGALDACSASKPGFTAVGRADSAGIGEVSIETRAKSPAHWFVNWYALGLSALSTAVEAQMAFMEDLLQVPQVSSALRQQILFNDFAKAFCPKRSDVRTSLH